ncbi:MAG: SUF system NifU family Fe-S cluster assembly protein [Bacillota bacterium]|nr:SUF system NifU family Fe-S cluster assembly protein [Bacillota bacterium]
MYSSDLYRQIIMDHYQNPRNHRLSEDPDYHTVRLKNPSCGDDITVQVRLCEGRVADCRQNGTGCSICCSSASMMSELLQEKSAEEALELIACFRKMVTGEPCDQDMLEEAQSLAGVSKLPPRVNCATLAWQAAERGILQAEAADGTADVPAGELADGIEEAK